VDQIRNEYRNRLNRVQENDDSQINFMKYNMQKFAHIMGKVGEDLCDRSQTMHDVSQMINSATDIKIFIEHNKSTNLTVNREKFQDFEASEQHTTLHDSDVLNGGQTTTFFIDENYMNNNVLPQEE